MVFNIDLDNDLYDVELISTSSGYQVIAREKNKYKNISSDFNIDSYINSEVHTIYQRPDGSSYVKKTKSRPSNTCNSNNDFYLLPGMINQYNHKVLDSYVQYCYKF